MIAERIVSQAQTVAAARNAAREAAKRSAAVLEGRRSTLDLAETEMAAWQEQWSTLLAKSWLADRSEQLLPEQVGAMLAVLQDLDKHTQRKADLEYRVAGMRKDQAAFERDIADLAGGSPTDDTVATFTALKTRATGPNGLPTAGQLPWRNWLASRRIGAPSVARARFIGRAGAS